MTVSPEEDILWLRIKHLGFQRQLEALTGVHTNRQPRPPRYFRLDFGISRLKIYIEVDGESHRGGTRQDDDTRRDLMLAKLGWIGMRISAHLVHTHLEQIVQEIRRFVKQQRSHHRLPA